MRAVLWFAVLFALAVATALFAGDNPGTVTLFWPPWRVDLSLNLVLLLLGATFLLLHLALRALAVLFSLPQQARRWRAQQRERAVHAAVFDAMSHLVAGRFIRARKSAQAALALEAALLASGEKLSNAGQLRALAHLLAAESAHALQDRTARDLHIAQAIEHGAQRVTGAGHETREGAQLRAARWALDDRDPASALEWLDRLAQGAARRTVALRIRLKAARQARSTPLALETARLLAKHRAFSAGAAQSIVRGLASDLLDGAHDPNQLQRVWDSLEPAERAMPELALQAARRLALLAGDGALVRAWLLPVWERMVSRDAELGDTLRLRLVRLIEESLDTLDERADREWLARIEGAQLGNPRDANLQYLAGMACLKRQLWGKAQQLLSQATLGLQDAGLRRNSWRALARLAEERGDESAAIAAWKQAAQV
ncbi:MAG: heme biosynthesis protein HemY [Ramlibacter sp.]|jgi:HemY protein|nr:heme biosynthesis protein HemY [Ramlibacter sp.]